MEKKAFVHPYIPNSVPEVREEMLKAIGVESVEELYAEIPDHLRFKGKMNLPEAIPCEYELKRHVEEILSKNTTCKEYLNFLGAGCWQHYVPAVVDEIVNRSEFLTAYCGGTYSDLGNFQARFEFYSLMGELLNLDVVSEPTYDWGTAAGLSLRMASRITGRNEVLIPRIIDGDRLSIIKNLCQPEVMSNHIAVRFVDYRKEDGLLDVEDLKRKISSNTAAVYIENPTYLGCIENQVEEIAKIAKENGALFIVGVDPISLGVLVPPGDYGADIVCGDIQPLGMHILCGGGQSGFIAFRDEEVYAAECPLALYSIAPTDEEGKYGYVEVLAERTSYGLRDKGKDWVGTASGLWTIGAAVYLSLMGPQGMREVGETIIQNANYAKKLIGEIDGVKTLFHSTFKEFVVNFDGVGKTVKEINRALEKYKIFGGKDLSGEFPELGNSALYCVTEIHTKSDIHKLVNALKEVVK
ncbi:MAG TPA: aminomethyl-transferring glycine dehydrogenase subunit GcvPA [Clostridiales bacterium]|nr:aminomethyl-transferring glycine dehydrogenase subunit GcvPA [Clostridiales bacterium]